MWPICALINKRLNLSMLLLLMPQILILPTGILPVWKGTFTQVLVEEFISLSYLDHDPDPDY